MSVNPCLSADDLEFRYQRTGPLLLHGLNVAFFPGEIVALTGASGSGKSTLLYLLALLIRPVGGTIKWFGAPVATAPDRDRSRLRAIESGFIFQDAMLDPSRTVIENVCEPAIFAGMHPDRALVRGRDLLESFGLANRADHRPGEISGGQAQRVGLCRALLKSPRLIFADEPTGNLDAGTADVVWDALVEHARGGATVLVATHEERLVSRADSVVILA